MEICVCKSNVRQSFIQLKSYVGQALFLSWENINKATSVFMELRFTQEKTTVNTHTHTYTDTHTHMIVEL